LTVERPAWQSIADAVELDDVEVDLIEIEVTRDLALVGTRLADYPPPDGMVITTLIREHKATIPLPDTVFSAGDFLIVAVNSGRDRVQEVTAWARGEAGGWGEVAG
jgi:Trk K+ transport system NAD-binding subunit